MQNLEKLRTNAGLTQTELAKMLDISPQRYHLYETGKRKMPVVLAMKAADYFNVSLEQIFLQAN